ncbi:MAG: hypothetical protein CSA58_10015, partial [Micrococcales bacterium]
LALLERGNSNVLFGNLLTLPIADGMLYVQPVYVQSSGQTAFPLLQKVLVKFGQDVGFADTLDDALNQVFEGDSGADAGDSGTPSEDGESEDPAASAQARLKSALDRANTAMEDGQRALGQNDFAGYGRAQERLRAAVADALRAEAEIAAANGETPAGEGEAAAEKNP